MTIRSAYRESLRHEGHVRDPAQELAVDRLARLQADLVKDMNPLRRIGRALRFPARKDYSGIPGLYLWGDVGRGKTFLMDLFFETLPLEEKTRIHFHRMMGDVHDPLQVYRAKAYFRVPKDDVKAHRDAIDGVSACAPRFLGVCAPEISVAARDK